ncbi:MAG: hypothetical protein ACJ71Z_06105 [Aeromicrobium sp.]
MTASQLSSDAQSTLDALRGDAAVTADDAWSILVALQDLAQHDTDAAEPILNELFAAGAVPTGLDGATDGILVATTTNRALDAAVKALTSVWMPWRGKRFDADSSTGDNRMTESSRLVGKILWPVYGMRTDADGRSAFDFNTYVEAGVEDPDVSVLVIDYASVPDNPKLVIKSIRDELVELVPGAYLGKIFFRVPSLVGDSRFERIGYFALRTP